MLALLIHSPSCLLPVDGMELGTVGSPACLVLQQRGGSSLIQTHQAEVSVHLSSRLTHSVTPVYMARLH